MKKQDYLFGILAVFIVFLTVNIHSNFKNLNANILEGSEQEKKITFPKAQVFPKVTKALFSPWVIPKPSSPKPKIVIPPPQPKVDPHEKFRNQLYGYQILGFIGEGANKQALMNKGDKFRDVKLNEILEGDLYIKKFLSNGVIISSKSDSTFQQNLIIKE